MRRAIIPALIIAVILFVLPIILSQLGINLWSLFFVLWPRLGDLFLAYVLIQILVLLKRYVVAFESQFKA